MVFLYEDRDTLEIDEANRRIDLLDNGYEQRQGRKAMVARADFITRTKLSLDLIQAQDSVVGGENIPVGLIL